MKTTVECYPCFFKQAIRTTRMLKVDPLVQKEVLNTLCTMLPGFDPEKSPPEMGEILYNMIAEKTGIPDPFKMAKEKSNRLALDLMPHLREKINKAEDKLFAAVKLAIFGNIIDYGAVSEETVQAEVNNFLNGDHRETFNTDLDFEGFKQFLASSKTILYLGDNAGEIVFDRILVEELVTMGKDVIFSVRGKPAINDALMHDAEMTGLTSIVKVIDNGTGVPGTVLNRCSVQFREAFIKADMVISKGQGNFETLSNEESLDKIFFMLKVKCPVVSNEINEPVGTMVLKNIKATH